MAKLTSKELENAKKQLGADREIVASSDTSADFGTTADARVPSLDSLQEAPTAQSKDRIRVDGINGKSAKKTKRAAANRKSSKESDYSVRSRSKGADASSKVDIFSSKSNKIVYRQG
jgi:hypothetical protein